MKIKSIIKTILTAFAAVFLSFAVLMSSAHMKDIAKGAVKDPSHDSGTVARSVDPVARAMSDLHNHTDKQTLKAISMDNPVTARQREINALKEEKETRNIVEIIEEVLIFYRLAFALRLSMVVA